MSAEGLVGVIKRDYICRLFLFLSDIGRHKCCALDNSRRSTSSCSKIFTIISAFFAIFRSSPALLRLRLVATGYSSSSPRRPWRKNNVNTKEHQQQRMVAAPKSMRQELHYSRGSLGPPILAAKTSSSWSSCPPHKGVGTDVVDGEVKIVFEDDVVAELDGALVAPENVAVVLELRIALEPDLPHPMNAKMTKEAARTYVFS